MSNSIAIVRQGGLNIPNVEDNTLLGVVDGQLVGSGVRAMSTMVDIGERAVRTGVRSVQIGSAHEISSSGENLTIKNVVSNVNFHPTWQTADPSGNWKTVQRTPVGNLIENHDFNSESGSTITNPDFTITSLNVDHRLYAITVNAVSAQTNVTLSIYTQDTLFWQDTFSNLLAGLNTYQLSNFIDLNASTEYRITATSTDGDVEVLGGASIPFIQLNYRQWVDVPVVVTESGEQHAIDSVWRGTLAQYQAITSVSQATVYFVSDSGIYLGSTKIGELDTGTTGGGVTVEDVLTSTSATNALSANQGRVLHESVQALINQRIVSGRGFRTLNSTTFEIDENNLGDFQNINTIYAAGINKRSTWTFPSSQEIMDSGVAYPILMEFTMLGGTDRITQPDNRLVLELDSADTTTISNLTTGLVNLREHHMLQGDVAVFTKTSATANWEAVTSLHDASTAILPSGTWEFHGSKAIINNITALATELNGVDVNSGDVFFIENGGEYFGETIGNKSLIVAFVDNPDLTTNGADDWYIINDGKSALTNEQILFLNQVTRTGSRFDLSREVFVNAENVQGFNGMASNTPLQLLYFDSNGQGVPTSRVINDQALRFSDLVGGNLQLSISFAANTQSGFAPELTSVSFNYGSGVEFVFPLNGVDPTAGSALVDIVIPNQDYTSILNSNCDVTLNYIYRGDQFIGVFTIQALVNTRQGTLNNAVTNIANMASAAAENRVNARIDSLASGVDQENAILSSIQPRISPLISQATNTPNVNTLFLDSTGSDSPPSDLSIMSSVSASNPRFTVAGTFVFIAVIGGDTYTLKNITQSQDTALVNGPNVQVLESVTFSGSVYFVYRVSGLTANDVIEVETSHSHEVVKWENDIDNLQGDIDRLDAKLDHVILDIPEAVANILRHETTVTEQSNPVINATPYNISLSNNAGQAVFFENNPNTSVGGSLNSKPISENMGNSRFGNKLLYINHQTFVNQAYVTAFDGSTGRDLITFVQGQFFAKQFVAAIPSSTVINTVYPAPSNRVSGQGVWIDIPTLTFVNGVPTVESDEVFFTRNIPASNVAVTIQYRAHANGNIVGLSTATLAAGQTFTTATINVGSESATLEVRRWEGNQIRVSVTEQLYSGLPTIQDIDVILSFQETRTVPATPATSRDIYLEHLSESNQVFAFRRSTTDTLVIVGTVVEVDTGYQFDTLFGMPNNGFLTLTGGNGMFYDYEGFTPINTTVTDLENHSTLTQYGLFTTSYTHETIVELGTQLIIHDSLGGRYNVGDALRALGATAL